MKSLLRFYWIILIALFASSVAHATLYTIQAGNNQFTQDFDSILVGDTVKWVWLDGEHTTTSNGIPNGAQPWNVLLDKLHTSFTYVVSMGGTYNYISVPDAPGMGASFVASYPTGISNPAMNISNFIVSTQPGSGTLQIRFTLAPGSVSSARIDVSFYNILATKLRTFYHGNMMPGAFSQNMELPGNLSPGIYFVALRVNDATLTRRIVIQ